MNYSEYLASPEWKRIRRKVIARDSRRCRVCDRSDRVEVHHRRYSARAEEQTEDLITLCHECHEIFHHSTSSPQLHKGNGAIPAQKQAPLREKNLPNNRTAFNGHLWLPPLPAVDMDTCRLCAKSLSQKRRGVLYIAGNVPVCSACFTDYAELRDEIYRCRNASSPKSVYVIRRVEFVVNLVAQTPGRELITNMNSLGRSVARKVFTPDAYTDKNIRADEDYRFDATMYEWWARLAKPESHFSSMKEDDNFFEDVPF